MAKREFAREEIDKIQEDIKRVIIKIDESKIRSVLKTSIKESSSSR
jgi:hypothetical protein